MRRSKLFLVPLLSLIALTAATADTSDPPLNIYVGGAFVGKGFVLNSITYVPLRLVGESLGATVDYNRFQDRVDVSSSALTPKKSVDQVEGLNGLHGVHVSVEDFRADAEADGLKASDIKDFVEGRLSNNKIPILSEQEMNTSPGRPMLYININPVKDGEVYAYSLNVFLQEDVSPLRRTNVELPATVWYRGSAGTVAASSLASLKTEVGNLIDSFTADYTKSN